MRLAFCIYDRTETHEITTPEYHLTIDPADPPDGQRLRNLVLQGIADIEAEIKRLTESRTIASVTVSKSHDHKITVQPNP